jgi:hypothetical protein
MEKEATQPAAEDFNYDHATHQENDCAEAQNAFWVLLLLFNVPAPAMAIHNKFLDACLDVYQCPKHQTIVFKTLRLTVWAGIKTREALMSRQFLELFQNILRNSIARLLDSRPESLSSHECSVAQIKQVLVPALSTEYRKGEFSATKI